MKKGSGRRTAYPGAKTAVTAHDRGVSKRFGLDGIGDGLAVAVSIVYFETVGRFNVLAGWFRRLVEGQSGLSIVFFNTYGIDIDISDCTSLD